MLNKEQFGAKPPINFKIQFPSIHPSCQTNTPGDQDVVPGEELDTPEKDTGYDSIEPEILEEIIKVERQFLKLFSFSYFQKSMSGVIMKETHEFSRQ